MKVCIVIPVYNEEKRISRTFEDLDKTLLRKYDKNLTLLFVCDGSTDKTEMMIKRYAKLHNQVRLITEKKRLGKGGAVIKGFSLLCDGYNPDIIGFVDADSSVSGTEVIKLLKHLGNNNIDGVIASRYLKNSKIIGNLGLGRFVASRSYNLLVRVLFGLDFSDTQCGAKFFKTKALCPTLRYISIKGMSFDINLIYEINRRNFRIDEVPVRYNVILEGTKVRLMEQVPKILIETLNYRITSL